MADEWEEPIWNPEDLDPEDTPPDTEDPDEEYAEDIVLTAFTEDDGSDEDGYYVDESDWPGDVPADDVETLDDAEDADEGDSLPTDPTEAEEDIFPEEE